MWDFPVYFAKFLRTPGRLLLEDQSLPEILELLLLKLPINHELFSINDRLLYFKQFKINPTKKITRSILMKLFEK